MCRSFDVYNYLKLCRWTSFQYRIKQHYNHNASGINHQTAAASFGRPIKGHMKYPLVFKSSFISCFFRHFSFFDLKKKSITRVFSPFHRSRTAVNEGWKNFYRYSGVDIYVSRYVTAPTLYSRRLKVNRSSRCPKVSYWVCKLAFSFVQFMDLIN